MKQWRIWSLLGILALVTTWFLHTLDEEEERHIIDTSSPDYTMEKFTSIHTDESGQLKSRLQAENMLHYSNRKTQLSAPSIIFYKQAEPDWFVQAEQGEISANREDVWLLGQAHLWQLDEHQKKRIEIDSSDIHVKLSKNYAETLAPTIVLMKNGKIHSTGVKVFTAEQRIELLSKVRGHYVFE